ncbi:hypothetical protein ACFLSJ_05130, partial [Verrucomicrobiota bacterium]
RNPWNEFECGHHYSRSLASYSVMLALSGFSYCAAEKRMGFEPKVSQRNFRCFFCVEAAWGTYRQKKGSRGWEVELAVDEGALPLKDLRLPAGLKQAKQVRMGAKVVPFTQCAEDGCTVLRFRRSITVRPGKALQVR